MLGKWSGNRIMGRRLPLVGVFSLTHYCNFYCPMCPFGDPDKVNQLNVAKKNDLSTDQWKLIFDKVSKHFDGSDFVYNQCCIYIIPKY